MHIINKYMISHINEIIQHHSGRYIKIEVILLDNEDDTFSFKIQHIDKLEILQDYLENFLDIIFLYTKLHLKDIYTIFNRINSLRCRLTISYVDLDDFSIDYNIPYIIKEYIVHILNLEEINKLLPKYTLHEQDPYLEEQIGTTVPIILQLIDLDSYKIRKNIINVGFQRTSIRDILLFLISKLGFKIYYEDSYINKLIYQNINIPFKYSKINKIINYLHLKYGIYPYGMSYYIYNSLFYLYQPYLVTYDPENIHLPLVEIYKLPPKGYLGNTHTFIDNIDNNGILSILINGNIKNIIRNVVSIENEGNLKVYLRSDSFLHNTIIDDNISIKKSYDSLGISNEIKRLNDKSLNIEIEDATMNKYYLNSIMSERVTELLGITWEYAKIFRILPGSFVKLIYEQDNNVIFQLGRIEKINYIFTRHQQKLSKENIFRCDAKIILRLNTSYSKSISSNE